MPVLKYRDPSTGQFVELTTPGPPGPTGPTGTTAVSANPGNRAGVAVDGSIYVLTITNPMTRPEANARYLQRTGGAMTGSLRVLAPTAGGHAATKAYVDGIVNSGSKVWVQPSPPTSPSTGDILLRT